MSSVQSDVSRQSKIIVISIVVALVAVGYAVMTWFADNVRKQSQISAVQTQGQGTPTQESEHYSQVLDRYNRQNANTAEQTGDSFLSVLSNNTNHVSEQANTPAQPQQQSQVIYYQQPVQQNAQQEQMQGLMANWSPVPHSVARVATDGIDYAKSIMHVADKGQEQPILATSEVKIVKDFTLVPALLDTDIDTDEDSMVKASIPSGQYSGAVMYAMGYKRLTNTVDMTFTFMEWQGRSYKITAKAVDQKSMRTTLSGEVNNRYFSRLILPAIAMGIGRTGQLYEQASAQNIITPQGGVIQTHPSTPSAQAVGGTILGGIGNQAGQILTNDAAKLPVKQVLIPKGTTIGIQFIGPVLASDNVATSATNFVQQEQHGVGQLSVLNRPAP